MTNSMREAFEDHIKDCYNAEKQLVKALPKMIKKCSNEQLRTALQMHLEETNGHVAKCEEIAKMCNFKPAGMVCHGMMGIIEEADEHMKECKSGALCDAVIIACGQKAEHYEISNYGTARAWAEQLGLNECVPLIEEILHQEEAADKKLNQIAEGGVNREAAMMAPEQKDGKATRSAGTTRKTESTKSKVSMR